MLDDSLLPLLHVVRLANVFPFLAVEEAIGPIGPVALLLLLLLPLARVPGSRNQSLLTLIPLFLPILVSGRSVLVAIAVGFVVMSIIERHRNWMLFAGALLANLSSASVLMCIILLAVGDVKDFRNPLSRSQRIQRLIVFALLLVSFGLSAVDKFTGFGSGDAGYAAHAFATDNIFLQVISRSTIAVSIVEGQYMRSLAYGGIAALLILKFLLAFTNPRQRIARRVVICCIPGLLLEGLGVIAMVFPFIWLLRGFAADTDRSVLVVSQRI